MARKGNKGTLVILRREEVVEAGHHGGAWKVAYADFVTAMMAFFLLMWLINATTEEQRRGLADYFSPQNLFAHATSGSGRPFGGKTPFDDGALVSDRGAMAPIAGNAEPVPDSDPAETTRDPQADRTADGGDGTRDTYGRGDNPAPGPVHGTPAGQTELAQTGSAQTGSAQAGSAQAGSAQAGAPGGMAVAGMAPADGAGRERADFAAAAATIRAAVAADPALASLARQLRIDQVPEGLRIQIVDQDKRPMFATGSAMLDPRARALLLKIAPVLNRLREKIAVTGHTDAAPYLGVGQNNWELSSARAAACLHLLLAAGLPDARVARVSGVAARDPLDAADPMDAINRRIAIIVLRQTAPR